MTPTQITDYRSVAAEALALAEKELPPLIAEEKRQAELRITGWSKADLAQDIAMQRGTGQREIKKLLARQRDELAKTYVDEYVATLNATRRLRDLTEEAKADKEVVGRLNSVLAKADQLAAAHKSAAAEKTTVWDLAFLIGQTGPSVQFMAESAKWAKAVAVKVSAGADIRHAVEHVLPEAIRSLLHSTNGLSSTAEAQAHGAKTFLSIVAYTYGELPYRPMKIDVGTFA